MEGALVLPGQYLDAVEWALALPGSVPGCSGVGPGTSSLVPSWLRVALVFPAKYVDVDVLEWAMVRLAR
jgi:hypothetical protein